VISLAKTSVVNIAFLACDIPKDEAPWTNSTSLFFILIAGSFFPIMPVEATKILLAFKPDALATEEAMIDASFKPCLPVEQLALPLLTIIALNSLFFLSLALLIWTGAAHILLVVNLHAAFAGISDRKIAKSGLPDFFIPQFNPLAKKPKGRIAFLYIFTPPFPSYYPILFREKMESFTLFFYEPGPCGRAGFILKLSSQETYT
jgi:hypothetical protein